MVSFGLGRAGREGRGGGGGAGGVGSLVDRPGGITLIGVSSMGDSLVRVLAAWGTAWLKCYQHGGQLG